MRLICFSVTNYRSITTAHKIQMSNMTVLVGKNNEGKSNILRALSLAMDIMRYYSENPRISHISIRSLRVRYNWESDFPISLQERKPNGTSSIDLTFELTDDELQAIRTTTGIRLNSNLPIRVSMGKSDAIIDIPKRGTPAFANATNKQRIIEFVCNKIDFNFIPAVRTDSDAIRVLERLIERELYFLEENPDYINATATIERLQQEILDDISARIVLPLQTFLPSVRDMQIHIQKDQRRAALRRNIEVIIAEIQGFATVRNITYTKCNGSPNAELEDCLNATTYKQAIFDEFGVTLDVSEFRSNGKWSDRIASCFRSQGKQWGDRIEKKVKFIVANIVPADASVTLNPYKRTSIDALVAAVEEMI